MDNATVPSSPIKKFSRSKNNVVITGVCAGIAEYMKTEPANIRVIALLTLLFGGWSIVAYLITASLIPVDKNSLPLSQPEIISIRKENFKTVVGGLLILFGFYFAFRIIGIASSSRIFILPDDFIFSLAAFAIGIYFLIIKPSNTEIILSVLPEKLFRSIADRKVTGVCGGLAKYIGIDATILRIIFILATLLTLGIFALLYLILVVFIPYEEGQKFE
ncbi:MAG: PspC domain-containing protein [Ignavibacteriales bacterium]|nr:PspC domain-containing protein [Ignavibacteriales bacterium]